MRSWMGASEPLCIKLNCIWVSFDAGFHGGVLFRGQRFVTRFKPGHTPSFLYCLPFAD